MIADEHDFDAAKGKTTSIVCGCQCAIFQFGFSMPSSKIGEPSTALSVNDVFDHIGASQAAILICAYFLLSVKGNKK
jgi:hypothetical protein